MSLAPPERVARTPSHQRPLAVKVAHVGASFCMRWRWWCLIQRYSRLHYKAQTLQVSYSSKAVTALHSSQKTRPWKPTSPSSLERSSCVSCLSLARFFADGSRWSVALLDMLKVDTTMPISLKIQWRQSYASNKVHVLAVLHQLVPIWGNMISILCNGSCYWPFPLSVLQSGSVSNDPLVAVGSYS